jgi:hypothetical protein
MADIKLYQIPRSILAQEPKPVLEIDFVEELQAEGFTPEQLEAPQTLALIGNVAARVAERLGHAAKTNYGVLSVFDAAQMSAYQALLEDYRMNPEPETIGEETKKKKKKRKKKS